MGSKGMVVLGLLLAMVLVISSEVAARELTETPNTIDTFTKLVSLNSAEETNEAPVNDAKYPGRGYGGGYRRLGPYCGSNPRCVGGGRCRYGCCGHGPYKGCRCCSYAGEKPDADVQAEPHN